MRKLRRRRRLSMTSLIDVIFLLLLFFMLSSTFTRFAEVDLTTTGAGNSTANGAPPVFVTLAQDALRLNGTEAEMTALPDLLDPQRSADGSLSVLVAAQSGVTAQRLTDLLVALRAVPNLSVTVLETS